MKIKFLFTALFLISITYFSSAQDQSVPQQQKNVPVLDAWIDNNDNGICDNFEMPGTGRGFGRGAGYCRGYCLREGRGRAANQSVAFRQNLPQGQGRASGPCYGRGFGPGQGRGVAPGGRRFVDTDQNGICDLYETSVRKN